MTALALMTSIPIAVVAHAQPAGVFPDGGSDAQVAQLTADARQAETTIWSVDFSRHTITKAGIMLHTLDVYDEKGLLITRTYFDTEGQLDSKIIYQYTEDGRKRVSTTYSQATDRKSQTLYAYTADGYLARMRFTDADAVTISTTEVGTTKSQTMTQELYNDSEKVMTTYTYDANLKLIGIKRDDGHTSAVTTFSLAYNGLPARGTYETSDGRKQTLRYEFTTDEHGNWTRKVTYVDGVATELAERKIKYE